MIVDFWNFPARIVDAVDEHESINQMISGYADLTDIIIVANFLAKAVLDRVFGRENKLYDSGVGRLI